MKYILKLQLHQHSLLTRKVFSRHNFHHWSSSLDLLVIYIFKSSSSSSHLHHRIWIITGHHHRIWIITWSGSSLLDHHHWIWIITRSRSSLGHHHGCYLLILLITGSSTELALFHVGCTSTEPVCFHTGCIITELVLFHTRCGIYIEPVLFILDVSSQS